MIISLEQWYENEWRATLIDDDKIVEKVRGTARDVSMKIIDWRAEGASHDYPVPYEFLADLEKGAR